MLGIILQARTGSTRLPNKMILPFFEEKGILETILIRLKDANLHVPIVLATTTNKSDDILETIALSNEIPVFRGSESNVLDRFIKAGEKFNFTKIIRVCADNPLLDLFALKRQIDLFEMSEVDYLCFALNNNTPTIKTHYGFWTEGVKMSSLKKVADVTDEPLFLEHVTNYIYTHPNEFSIQFEKIDAKIERENNIRLTIDTIEDFKLVQKIYGQLKNHRITIEADEIVEFIKNNSEYIEIMTNEINKNTK
jgi:spore coat polysaccharide biosynthesis protein SpsF (cytidylyltransferase family)